MRALGADAVFCYRDTPVAEAVAEADRRSGRGRRGRHHRRPAVRRAPGRDGARTGGWSRAARTRARWSRWTSSSSSATATASSASAWPRRTRSGRPADGAGRPDHGPIDRTPPPRPPRRTRTWTSGGTSARSCWCGLTVCYLAHCLLNANAKVDEGARCAGVSAGRGAAARARLHDPADAVPRAGVRRHTPVLGGARAVRHAGLPRALRRWRGRRGPDPGRPGAGAPVLIVGIDGSPSMGVELTASDEWGGRPDKPRDEDYPVTPGPGLFTETLLGLLADLRPRCGSSASARICSTTTSGRDGQAGRVVADAG